MSWSTGIALIYVYYGETGSLKDQRILSQKSGFDISMLLLTRDRKHNKSEIDQMCVIMIIGI